MDSNYKTYACHGPLGNVNVHSSQDKNKNSIGLYMLCNLETLQRAFYRTEVVYFGFQEVAGNIIWPLSILPKKRRGLHIFLNDTLLLTVLIKISSFKT
jgi:hypothetical protein